MNLLSVTPLPADDLRDLEQAVRLLEHPGLPIRMANTLGTPVEWALGRLPGMVLRASHRAIEVAARTAIVTLDPGTARPSRDLWHKVVAGTAGAAGGAFGAAGLVVELPVTTTVILRSIADIARSEGEDLGHVDARLACVHVLGLGGRSPGDDAAESAFLAARAALADVINSAGQSLAAQQTTGIVGPMLARLTKILAKRFGIQVSQKLAVQALPVIGAASGALVNVLFIDHFQDMARGYFVVRRLERRWGAEAVDREYRRILAEPPPSPSPRAAGRGGTRGAASGG